MIRILIWLLPSIALLTVFVLATTEEQLSEPPVQLVLKEAKVKIVEKMETTATPETSTIPEQNETSKRNIYKWRDSKGTVIISSETPPSYVTAEVFSYEVETTDNHINTVQNTSNIQTNKKIHRLSSLSENPLRVYTPDGLRDLIQQSKEVGETIEIRGKMLDDLIEQL